MLLAALSVSFLSELTSNKKIWKTEHTFRLLDFFFNSTKIFSIAFPCHWRSPNICTCFCCCCCPQFLTFIIVVIVLFYAGSNSILRHDVRFSAPQCVSCHCANVVGQRERGAECRDNIPPIT